MHRKSLEAAEHIRKQDEIDVNAEDFPATLKTEIPGSSIDLKNKSANNLRAKAREHCIKLISKYATESNLENSVDYSGADESNSSNLEEEM